MHDLIGIELLLIDPINIDFKSDQAVKDFVIDVEVDHRYPERASNMGAYRQESSFDITCTETVGHF